MTFRIITLPNGEKTIAHETRAVIDDGNTMPLRGEPAASAATRSDVMAQHRRG